MNKSCYINSENVFKYVQKDERLPSNVHNIWKSAQTPKCLIVTQIKNENCADCEQGEEA